MKKIVSTADLGGAPLFKSDMREVFNTEIWDAIEALLAPFDADTEGLIISGCVITNNSGNFDMTAGIVYLNGEFMRIAAATNQAYTKHIAPATPTEDSRTYADGTSNGVVETKNAELVSSAPGSGQYITINNLSGAEERRWSKIIVNKQIATVFAATLEALGGIRTEGSGPYLKTKVVDIGDWNMDATTSVGVAHGVDFTKIRSVSGVIRADANGSRYEIGVANTASGAADVFFPSNTAPNAINSTTIMITRLTGGLFDANADFDEPTGYNRGWLVITYEV